MNTFESHLMPSSDGAISLRNAESGVILRVGEQLLLDLGEREWKVRCSDESILRFRQASAGPKGMLAYLEALKPGKTKLYATSDTPARPAAVFSSSPTLFIEIPIAVML